MASYQRYGGILHNTVPVLTKIRPARNYGITARFRGSRATRQPSSHTLRYGRLDVHGLVISTALHVPIHSPYLLVFGSGCGLWCVGVCHTTRYPHVRACLCKNGATDMGYERTLDAHGWICCSAAIHPVFLLRVLPLKLPTIRRSRSLREVVFATRDGACKSGVSAVHTKSNNGLMDNIGLHVARHLEDLGRTVSHAMPQCMNGDSSNATRCQ